MQKDQQIALGEVGYVATGLKDIKLIHIGDTIQIPEDLLIKRRAMPSDFLKPKTLPKRTSPQKPSAPSIKADEITLYGPIGNDAPAPDTKKSDLPVPLETLD